VNPVEVRDQKLLATERQTNEVQIEGRVVSQIRSLEKWYAAEFERRLSELSVILQSQLDARVEEARAHFEKERKVRQSPAETPENLVQEIQRSEADGQKLVSELERMVADDSVALGKLLQKRSQELELKAYIRGLKFRAEALTNPTANAVEASTKPVR
jgi:hypothetical protein